MEQLYVPTANGQYRQADKDEILKTAAELSLNSLPAATTINSAKEAADYIRIAIAGRETEAFVALWLGQDSKPISLDVMSEGNLTQVEMRIRETVRTALDRNASAVVFAHNHPMSEREPVAPSNADIKSFVSIKFLMDAIDVNVIDELVVNKNGFYSLATDKTMRPRLRELVDEFTKENGLEALLSRLDKIIAHSTNSDEVG